ncbi:hypothetical protein ORI20_05765 [Mycobacterium sp. CVI_P3]|uniref:Uncharacterized protein n=1 Tax=Mycobacterium pinniadriaticum TaxID=2994102 RepID=A0ABT3SAQ4_9MYCO|nr:hypothetical protein [Mycobacterium pinniadriaticum]MCX2929769.1 hypothetical protein [Mycobacterium pinniadriaticum]MCX2936193.1 hypothetical protein [Mycobacterium pinniadriaticum]
MKDRIIRWLERAASSLSGAAPLAPIDASWSGGVPAMAARVPAMDEGRSRGAGRLPMAAAAHLPAF